jgi:hypothetical protein
VLGSPGPSGRAKRPDSRGSSPGRP